MNKEPFEKDIQRGCCEYLNRKGYFFWRSNNIPVFGQSNDGQKRFRAMPKYALKGIPDIMIIKEGRFIGIEVKREGGKIRPEQEVFNHMCTINGGYYFVVHSVEELTLLL